MQVKEWLSRAHRIDVEINNIIEERDKVFNRAVYARAKTERNTESHNRSHKNFSEPKVISYIAYTDMLDNKIDELYKVKREIVSAIWQVENSTLRKLLFARYIQSKTWEQIAEIINKQDVKWVRTAIHSRALKEIEKIISKRDSM